MSLVYETIISFDGIEMSVPQLEDEAAFEAWLVAEQDDVSHTQGVDWYLDRETGRRVHVGYCETPEGTGYFGI